MTQILREKNRRQVRESVSRHHPVTGRQSPRGNERTPGGARRRGADSTRPDPPGVVGVADCRLIARQNLQMKYSVKDCNVFDDWKGAAAQERFADAVIIATPDRQHKEPAVAFAEKGYHILLEKPMAVTVDDCKEIVAVCKKNNVILSVCHVLRYSPVVLKVTELLSQGVIGEVVHIQHLEPVGFYHFAHSFVRGNWRNEQESTFSLMAKSCHDIDIINSLMGGKRCIKVSSFGSLSHFTKENKPKGAAARCLDCAVEESCPYSAKKLYLEGVKNGKKGWPISVICEGSVVDIESVTKALCEGPYGRCVYECDNDVVTHQVVNMEFEGGMTAAFTMVAFTEKLCDRRITVYGTKGELSSEGQNPVTVFDFLTQTKKEYPSDYSAMQKTHLGAHGGADYYLMDSFIQAVAENNPSLIRTGPEETLASHLLVFDAERARRENRVVCCD
ncbi:putative oxidoreductase YteT isoform X3 [Heptranchias perlo]|uniref:putative oxidoreductase YteT isoform X3 n=1 Tax=Heptranchias perlo TaxID=212740 RepID=UPI003559CD7D